MGGKEREKQRERRSTTSAIDVVNKVSTRARVKRQHELFLRIKTDVRVLSLLSI